MLQKLKRLYRLYQWYKAIELKPTTALTSVDEEALASLYNDPRYKSLTKLMTNAVFNLIVKNSRDGVELKDFLAVNGVEEYNKIIQTIVKDKFTKFNSLSYAEAKRQQARAPQYNED